MVLPNSCLCTLLRSPKRLSLTATHSTTSSSPRASRRPSTASASTLSSTVINPEPVLPRPAGAVPDYVLLVSQQDGDLQAFKQAAIKRLETVRSRRFHAKVMELVAIVRARLAHHHGDSAFWAEMGEHTDRSKSVVVPLGWLRSGLADECSLLLKILCDVCAIDCRLVRGKGPEDRAHTWNFVRERDDSGLGDKWFLVDVIHNVKHACPSEAASNYLLYQQQQGATSAANGMPAEERPFDPSEDSLNASGSKDTFVYEDAKTAVRTGGVAVICPCDDMEEFGLMVQCSVCSGWSHAVCLNMNERTANSVDYHCWLCTSQHRPVQPHHQHVLALHDKLIMRKKEAAEQASLPSSPSVAAAGRKVSTGLTILQQQQQQQHIHHHIHHIHHHHHHHVHGKSGVHHSPASPSSTASDSPTSSASSSNGEATTASSVSVSSDPESLKIRLVIKGPIGSNSTIGRRPSVVVVDTNPYELKRNFF